MSDVCPAEITAVGLGSAGSKVVSLLSKQSLLIERFVYVSCDRNDFSCLERGERILVESAVDQKLNPAMVRGLAFSATPRIRSALAGSKIVFVVAGLGGATGSGLAPLVASIANECGAITVGVALMPFDYEKKLKFHAGVSLRRLRSAARGVITIDNDILLTSCPRDSTLVEIYEAANNEAVKALRSLLSSSSEATVPVGLNKLLSAVLGDGYSLLGMSSSNSSDKAEQALAGAVVSIGKIAETAETSRAVVVLTGDKSLSATEVGVAVKQLGSMLNSRDVDVEYGVSYSGTAQLQVSLLASGLRSTKYDDYDPLQKVLQGRVLDDEIDSSLPQGLELLQPCE
jgi:cell division protein FtsZ